MSRKTISWVGQMLTPGMIIASLLVVTALTVNRFAPTDINADLAINSVMSLQNITLFYWGQNRLANALPLLAGAFTNPAANFYAVLYFSTAAHFLLIFVAAHLSNRLVTGRTGGPTSDLCVFLVVCVAQFVVQRNQEFVVIAGHIEYALSAALILLAFLLAISDRVPGWIFAPLMLVCVVVATGVNFSVVLAALALTIGYLLVERKVNRRILALMILSVVSAIVWFAMSLGVGGSSYTVLRLHNIPVGVWNVVIDFLRAFDMWRYLAILAVFAVAIFAANQLAGSRDVPNKRRLRYIFILSLLFSIFWLLLFSANRWVEYNAYSYRYFTYIIYVLFFYISCLASILLYKAGKWTVISLGTAAAMALTLFLWAPIIPLRDFRLFQEVRSHSEDHYALYAGNYWQVWPAVLRSLIAGHQSFGLAYRGEANTADARAFVTQRLDEEGSVRLLCIDDATEDCLKQAFGILEGVTSGDVRKLSSSTQEIDLRASSEHP